MKKIITKARNDESSKEEKKFVFSNFRVFVINPLIQNPISKIYNYEAHHPHRRR